MSPWVRAGFAVAILSGLSRAAELERPRDTRAPAPSVTAADGSQPLESSCPPGTLPDANVCIPVPIEGAGGEELTAKTNVHRERSGRWRVYDQIPRRPERPADYRLYRMPVPPIPGQSFVMSGYDLHLPDASQRRGAELSAVGHGGIDIAQKRGTEVRLINLTHQLGDAEVLYMGALFGTSVVTRHTLREGGALREYVVIFGHLDGTAPGLARGTNLREGSLLGFVGDSGSPGA
ncbi:MAG TPA: M23 family metallopeptidase, partial [Polyangiaceae bacterium]|nr:M23 family metallopeptidase [Polyangiaceae bacterium]